MNQSINEIVLQKFISYFKNQVGLKKENKMELESSNINIVGTVNPLPESCLKDTKLYDLKYLNPVFSIEGHVISKKYKELKFHFLTCPVNLEYVDYRILKDNTYEVLGTNIHRVSDYDTYDEFVKDLNYEENGHFDSNKESVTIATKKGNTENYEAYALNVDKCNWCQGTYEMDDEDFEERLSNDINTFIQHNSADESIKKYLDEDYERYQKELLEHGYSKEDCLSFSRDNLKQYLLEEFYLDFEEGMDNTDYTLEELKDENGDALEFVGSIGHQFDIFGSYYLFYSSKTKLVRLFFQCT